MCYKSTRGMKLIDKHFVKALFLGVCSGVPYVCNKLRLVIRNYTKSKIMKILNYEKNSKRKVPNQIAKSNDKAHQKNGQQLSYS